MSTDIGSAAEKAASDYLINRGFKILDMNWKTPVCEIDIVTKKDNVIYFVEVKYRSSNKQGMGLDYITNKKLKQMMFAAECWIEDSKYKGDYCLSAIEVTGDFEVTEFIESII